MSRSRLSVVAALALLLSGAWVDTATSKETSVHGSYPIIELRQYTLKPGQRDTLITLFEREFVESQEAIGMNVIGTFRDLDRPDRFVWIRGFRDMDSRAQGLNAFYFGPVWQAHREEANATMIDSDNVLLLHAPTASAEFMADGRHPAADERAPAGLVVGIVEYLNVPAAQVTATFEQEVKPKLEKAGVPVIAWFAPETSPNNFPRLPVREGEDVLVWFTQFGDDRERAAHEAAIATATAALNRWLARPPEVLRLSPTSRSRLRGLPKSSN